MRVLKLARHPMGMFHVLPSAPAGTYPSFTGTLEAHLSCFPSTAGAHRQLAGSLQTAAVRYGNLASNEADEITASGHEQTWEDLCVM
jgi:hypothetical protein